MAENKPKEREKKPQVDRGGNAPDEVVHEKSGQQEEDGQKAGGGKK